MKQRLLVMNGQKLLQTERAGQWQVDKVEKAGAIAPGIYPLSSAMPANRASAQVGVVLHTDTQFVYQHVGKTIVRHDLAAFDQAPVIGAHVSITYRQRQAVVTAAAPKLGRKLSR